MQQERADAKTNGQSGRKCGWRHNAFQSGNFLIINIVLVSLIIGFALGVFSFSCSTRLAAGEKVLAQDKSQVPAELAALEHTQYSFRYIAEQVVPVVVEISTVDIVKQSMPDSPFEWFFNPQDDNKKDDKDKDKPKPAPKEKEYKKSGLGSGVIVRRNGNTYYVLTNNHVVGEAEEISVTVNLGKEDTEYKATLIGGDERTDLALVSFESKENLPVAKLGDSDASFVGDWVLAIGNPFGYESTVTAGIISASGRRGGPSSNINEFIQTDAAINPGNSGGALVNIRGEVIGINTWIASNTGTSMGYGFAIPINSAKKAIDDFIKQGKIEYAWLGVQITTPDKELIKALKLGTEKGALVLHVFKGSPAEKGGILPGDYITRLNEIMIKDHFHLTQFLGGLDASKQAEFELIRLGEKKKLSLKLAVREDEKKIAALNKNLWPGLTVYPLTAELKKELETTATQGLVIDNTLEGTPADTAGFKSRDIITRINDTPVETVMDFYKALNASGVNELKFRLLRNNTEVVIGLIR
jgi:Do/DeqQ family serine protease